MAEFNDIYKEGRPIGVHKSANDLLADSMAFNKPPLTRDQSVRALTAVSHMLEAAAHLLMIGKDAPARDLIAEANVVMEEVPSIDRLEKI